MLLGGEGAMTTASPSSNMTAQVSRAGRDHENKAGEEESTVILDLNGRITGDWTCSTA